MNLDSAACIVCNRPGSVAFTGPGRFSVDALLGFELGELHWGLLALAAGVVAGGIQLAARRPPRRRRTRPDGVSINQRRVQAP
jgi:hypothetical protein